MNVIPRHYPKAAVNIHFQRNLIAFLFTFSAKLNLKVTLALPKPTG